MSGTAPNLPVQITLTGMPQVEAGLKRVGETAQQAMGSAGSSAASATAGMGRFNQVIQQGGYQLGDFAVQVQGGQSALVALSQQGSQFLGMFGPMGAVAGVILTVGSIAAGFLTAGENAKEAEKMAKSAFEGMAASAEGLKKVLQEVNGLFLSNAERAAASANASRDLMRTQTESLLSGAVQRNEGNTTALSEAQAYLTRLETYASRQEALRSRLRASGQMSPEGEATTDQRNLFEARARVQGLRQDISRTADDIGKMNEALKGIRNSGRVGVEELGPTSADPFGTNALRTSLDGQLRLRQEHEKKVAEINRQRQGGHIEAAEQERLIALATKERDEALGKLDGTAKGAAAARSAESKARREELRLEKEEAEAALKIYDRLRVSGRSELLLSNDGDAVGEAAALAKIRGTALDPAVRERDQKKIERDLEASQKRQEQDIKTSTNSIVDYSANAFADLFEQNGTGWKGMLDTFETTAKKTFARIAADAIIRPIVTPIVTSLMGGGTASASGVSAGGAGGVAGAANAGGFSTMDAAKMLGKTFTGGEGGLYKTGFESVDSVVNANAYSGFGGSSVSYGQAATGALGVAGGAYGIYQGFQTGGAKGFAQGVGGAASMAGGAAALAGGAGASAALGAIATVAPYVAVAALIASYFLSGQKPSDKTGVFRSNLQTGLSNVGGLEGDRFSQENRDLASNLGKSVSDMAATLRGAMGVASTPFNFEIAAGTRDGLIGSYGGRERKYGNDETGAKQLIADMTAALIDSMKGLASAEVQSVLNNSNGIEATLANLDFYNGTYQQLQKPFAEASSGLELFNQQITALVAPFTEASAKARELGLATETLAKRAQEATDVARAGVAKGYDQSMWQSEGRGFIQSLRDVRENYETNSSLYRSVGRNPEDLYNAQARSVLGTLDIDQLKDISQSFVGWDDAMAVLAREVLANTEATLAATAAAEAAEVAERNAMNVRTTNYGLWDRIQSANGAAATLDGQLQMFDRQAELERMTAAKDGATDMLLLERTLSEERLAIQRDFAERATAADQQSAEARLRGLETLKSESQVLRGFLDSQAVSGAGVSPQNAFLAAQAQFNEALGAARQGGSLNAYTSAASNLLSTSNNFLGGGGQATAIRDMVLSTTQSLGASLDLPGFSDNIEAGFDRIMSRVEATLERRLAQIYEELRSTRLMAAA